METGKTQVDSEQGLVASSVCCKIP